MLAVEDEQLACLDCPRHDAVVGRMDCFIRCAGNTHERYWSMRLLEKLNLERDTFDGRIAVVTGAARGIGRSRRLPHIKTVPIRFYLKLVAS